MMLVTSYHTVGAELLSLLLEKQRQQSGMASDQLSGVHDSVSDTAGGATWCWVTHLGLLGDMRMTLLPSYQLCVTFYICGET